MHPNRNKLVIAAAVAGVLLSSVALAQPSRHGQDMHHMPRGAEHQLARLDEALDLTDEQSAELLPILQEAEAERRELHERMMEEFRPEFCALMEDTHSQVAAVLTPEQAEQFDEIKSEHLDRLERHRGGRGKPAIDC